MDFLIRWLILVNLKSDTYNLNLIILNKLIKIVYYSIVKILT